MHLSVVTLFPEFFEGPLTTSIPARALAEPDVNVDCVNPRDYATDRHRTTDDTPYGGGAGMVLRAPELEAAVHAAHSAGAGREVWLMSPQGRCFDQKLARDVAEGPGVIIVCGRYEGVDERFVERCVDREVRIGDFVLSGGEPAAMCMIDAILRLHDGVLGNRESLDEESFAAGTLEYPQFTRPAEYGELEVPSVLLSGNHGRVERWRRRVSLLRTRARRPDLFERLALTEDDLALIADTSLEAPEWLTKARKPGSGS